MSCCRLSSVPLLSFACISRPPTCKRFLSSMRRQEIHSALGCNVYVSEGRDKGLVDRLRMEATAAHGVALANVFVDEHYHRTGFTFVSDQPDRLAAAVVRLSRAALALLDLQRHDASHPRLGVVDHISLHPLGSLLASLPNQPHNRYASSQHQAHSAQQQQAYERRPAGCNSGAAAYGSAGDGPGTVWEPPPRGLAGMAVPASCAQDIAWSLSGIGDHDEEALEEHGAVPEGGKEAAEAGRGTGQSGGPYPHLHGIPVYLYGYAHSRRKTLAEVRRELGYFRSGPDGSWHGDLAQRPDHSVDMLRYPPDLGPLQAPARSGLVTIGAVPWVVNYNIPLVGVGLQEAKALARALSERGGGLPAVEAMALKHAQDSDADPYSVEVACNLLDEVVSPPLAVQARLEALLYTRGLDSGAVLPGYRTNKSPEELLRAAAESVERWKG